MWMLQPGGELYFSFEAIDFQTRSHVGRQNFDNHLAIELCFARDENATHPGAAQLVEDDIVLSKRFLQLRKQC